MSKTHVPLDQVRDNPHQPRLDIGDVEALAETILQHGLRQLPEARLVVDGTQPSYSSYTYAEDQTWYLEEDEMALAELASGHRRVEAIRQLNLDDTVTDGDLRDVGLTPGYVPVDLQRLSDEEMLDLLTIENAQRESLSPIEEARLIGEMVDAGRDAVQIAERFGKSPSWVSNRKRLTTLPVYVQEHVHDGKISVRQAQPLATAFAVEEEHPDLVQQVNVGLKPGTMAGKAMRGHLTSDDIRDRTDELIDVVERVEESRSSSPQDLPCAFCKAEAGESCTTGDGKKTDFHSAREKAYDAWQDGRLEYGSVTIDHLRRLISPPSTEVNYRSDEYTLVDLVAAHQVIRGYDAPARSGHKGRARKIRVEMQRRVDPNGKVNTHPLSAEEVIRSAPKQLRDRLPESAQDTSLEVAINRAANQEDHKQDSDSTTQSDDSREAREENPQGDGGPASSALSKANADSGERGREGSSSRSQQNVEGGEARRTERERGDAEGAADRDVSGDGAPSSDSSTGHPAHLLMVIDAVEADGHDWKLQSFNEGHYQGTVQNGGTAHIAEGSTPAEALQAAWHSAQNVPADKIGTIDRSDVDRLLSADGTEMWDDQAAGEASIASLLVAHRVAGERQETWRTQLIAEAVEERVGRVDRDDVPEDVLEEVQAEVERRLEPVEA